MDLKKRDFLIVYHTATKPRKKTAISINQLPKYLSENRVRQVMGKLLSMTEDKARIGLYDEGVIFVYRR